MRHHMINIVVAPIVCLCSSDGCLFKGAVVGAFLQFSNHLFEE